MPDSPERTPLYAWYAPALLIVVYILNFLDRTIICILFPLIKREMEFSDTQRLLDRVQCVGRCFGPVGYYTDERCRFFFHAS